MLCTIERKRNNIRNIFNIRKQFNTFWIWLYWIWFRWDFTGWVLWHRLCICFGVNDWVRRTHIKSLYVYAYDAMRSSLCACVIFLSFLLAVTAHTMLIHILLNGEQLTTFLWAIRLASMTFLLYNKVTAQYYTLYKICACSMERVLLIIFFSLSHWFDDTVLNTQKFLFSFYLLILFLLINSHFWTHPNEKKCDKAVKLKIQFGNSFDLSEFFFIHLLFSSKNS